MAPETRPRPSTNRSETTRRVRKTTRRVRVATPPAVDGRVPAWYPELMALYLERRRLEKARDVAMQRADLAVWYVIRHKGQGQSSVARCLGVSKQWIDHMLRRAEKYVAEKGLAPEDVAVLLFSQEEKVAARQERRRRQRAALERKLSWYSVPGPEGRPLPPPEERGWSDDEPVLGEGAYRRAMGIPPLSESYPRRRSLASDAPGVHESVRSKEGSDAS